MRIGTETGSLSNHLLSRAVVGQPTPVVGMGVTFLHWTDRSAGTIQKVFKIGSAVAIECTQDKATRTDSNGMSDCQSYSFEEQPDGYRSTYRQRANGMWEQVFFNDETKRWKKQDGGGLRIGVRDAHYDYSF